MADGTGYGQSDGRRAGMQAPFAQAWALC